MFHTIHTKVLINTSLGNIPLIWKNQFNKSKFQFPSFVKVAPKVEKTLGLQKRLKFCKSDIFCELRNEKTLFSIMDERNTVFSLFYHRITFCSTELFDCTVNFKFYLNIAVVLNVNTNQTSKEQYLNLKAATYFGISRTKKFWK